MKPEAERVFYAEEKRHLDEVTRMISRWPEYRAHFAHGLLASAVAICDSYGIDVEAFVRELRARMPRPAVLVPPKSRSS